MKINIKIIQNDYELGMCQLIRKEVFILEQNISKDIEMDDRLINATHILATIQDEPVGTARWRETEYGIKLERFAVLKKYRGKGVGQGLARFAIEALNSNKNIYLNAQESVIKFYEKLGFISNGCSFIEAEIPHQKMVYSG